MDIGTTIRAVRKRKNITIAQICEQTGLSQGFMSQVETNKTSPSIATLENISTALDVPLAYLLLKKEERMKVTRKEERSLSTAGPDRLQIQHLSSTKNMRVILVDFPPGTSTGETPRAHEGEEVHYVMQGMFQAEQGEDVMVLNEGDTFSWNACIPHTVRNIGEQPGTLLISVYTETDQELTLF
jgi:transcriptional regulator with XRE-family HTH domain